MNTSLSVCFGDLAPGATATGRLAGLAHHLSRLRPVSRLAYVRIRWQCRHRDSRSAQEVIRQVCFRPLSAIRAPMTECRPQYSVAGDKLSYEIAPFVISLQQALDSERSGARSERSSRALQSNTILSHTS